MPVDDALIPAARHLFGTDAEDLLGAALAHVGGRLLSATPVQAQHRPGRDLVVRYDAEVSWEGGVRHEVLLAAATVTGPPPGTLPLVAGDLEAGVWRYPFDPHLPGLPAAVTPRAGEDLAVVAYRPTRRAVVRATAAGGPTTYRKVVRPRLVVDLVESHHRLSAAGLAVPPVVHADAEAGLLVLGELGGRNLRDLILDGEPGWPPPRAFGEVIGAIATVAPGPRPRRAPLPLAEATRSHARALLAVLADQADRLDRIVAATDAIAPPAAGAEVLVHGDLYEAQLVVEGGAVTGVLDLDDLHLGDARDDAANVLAHLHVLEPVGGGGPARLARYRRRVRTDLVEQLAVAPEDLDLRTAAVLVGLATGPFRAQRGHWEQEVRRRLATAERLVRPAARSRERTLRIAS